MFLIVICMFEELGWLCLCWNLVCVYVSVGDLLGGVFLIVEVFLFGE